MIIETGIYKIINTINGNYYLGSTTISFKRRCSEHFSDLKLNKHHSPALQNAYNKYGKENFKFEVIHKVPCEYVHSLEQWYLNTQECEYNISKKVKGGYRVKSEKEIIEIFEKFASGKYKSLGDFCSSQSQLNMKVQTLQRIIRRKVYSNVKVPKILVEKANLILDNNIKNRGNNRKKKLTKQQVSEIKYILKQFNKVNDNEIAKYYNVSHGLIGFIRNNVYYKDITCASSVKSSWWVKK